MQNVNTIDGSLGNAPTLLKEIDDRKHEVIAFVVNACMNVTANNLYIQLQERLFFV